MAEIVLRMPLEVAVRCFEKQFRIVRQCRGPLGFGVPRFDDRGGAFVDIVSGIYEQEFEAVADWLTQAELYAHDADKIVWACRPHIQKWEPLGCVIVFSRFVVYYDKKRWRQKADEMAEI